MMDGAIMKIEEFFERLTRTQQSKGGYVTMMWIDHGRQQKGSTSTHGLRPYEGESLMCYRGGHLTNTRCDMVVRYETARQSKAKEGKE